MKGNYFTVVLVIIFLILSTVAVLLVFIVPRASDFPRSETVILTSLAGFFPRKFLFILVILPSRLDRLVTHPN